MSFQFLLRGYTSNPVAYSDAKYSDTEFSDEVKTLPSLPILIVEEKETTSYSIQIRVNVSDERFKSIEFQLFESENPKPVRDPLKILKGDFVDKTLVIQSSSDFLNNLQVWDVGRCVCSRLVVVPQYDPTGL